MPCIVGRNFVQAPVFTGYRNRKFEGAMRIAVLAATGLLLSVSSLAQTHVCQSVVDAELSKRGIAPDSIASTEIETNRGSTGDTSDAKVYGYTYWMRMKSCERGYLQVTMWDSCQLIEAPFTSGPCTIPGIRKY